MRNSVLNNVLVAAFLFLLISYPTISAQNQIDENSVKDTINKIFDLSKSKKYDQVASYCAYSGSDASRKFKDTLNPQNESELYIAERLAKKIKAYLEISDSFSIEKFSKSTKDKINWVYVTVAFKSGKQKLAIPFKFVDNSGKLLLVEID